MNKLPGLWRLLCLNPCAIALALAKSLELARSFFVCLVSGFLVITMYMLHGGMRLTEDNIGL